jgi:SAM-dependent methyltransferase
MRLLTPQELEASAVVANCAMNRDRKLLGSNSYERELGLHIPSFLRGCSPAVPVSWIDLCCGRGRALIEATAELVQSGDTKPFQIEGIDLAGWINPNPFPNVLILHEQALEDWEPTGPYALVTCVHGLHYVGDKLAAITKAVAKLRPDGLFVANLDLANFRYADGRAAGRSVANRLRDAGLTYDARRRLIRCQGARKVEFGLRYVGADDRVGPNYTGQSAVDSYYAA